MRTTKQNRKNGLAVALALLGAIPADAAPPAELFKGGGYDGYGKQDTATLAIPAPAPKGTLILMK